MGSTGSAKKLVLKPRLTLGANGTDVTRLVSDAFGDGFITANDDGTFTLLDGTSYNTVGQAIEDTIRAIIGIDNNAEYQYSNATLNQIIDAVKDLSPSQRATINQQLSIFRNAAQAEMSDGTAYQVEANYILQQLDDSNMPLGMIINALK